MVVLVAASPRRLELAPLKWFVDERDTLGQFGLDVSFYSCIYPCSMLGAETTVYKQAEIDFT
jgi:hypothetical protein